jgi:factor associated with neutral sphingomyelinase activation
MHVLNFLHFFPSPISSKQRGIEAVKAHNVFYHLTYDDETDTSQGVDEARQTEVELHMAGFGRCPAQLFNRPHLPKYIHTEKHRSS